MKKDTEIDKIKGELIKVRK